MRPAIPLIALLALLLGAACQGAGDADPTVIMVPTAVAEPLIRPTTDVPTPTLVPPLATAAVASPTPTPTPTKPPTPTPTLQPAQLLARAEEAFFLADYDQVIGDLEALHTIRGELPSAAWLMLGRSLLADGRVATARDVLGAYLLRPDADPLAAAHLGESHAALGDCTAAAAAYGTFLDAYPETTAYVAARQASCYVGTGDRAAAIGAYERAVAAPAHRITAVENRLVLADLYLQEGRHADAVAQYDAILQVAETEFTRGYVEYLAGQALVAAGDDAAAASRYANAVYNYPRARESYLSLIALLDASVAVDPFQRGVVDYYAGAYVPAVAALENYLAGESPPRAAEARLFLAWSLEALGRVDDALAVLAASIPEVDPATDDDASLSDTAAEAWLERAAMLGRHGRTPAALAVYDDFIAGYAEHARAPDAAYDAAWLATRLVPGYDEAIARWTLMADLFPADRRAPEALFRGGLEAWRADSAATARALWTRAVEHADDPFGAAALVWLLRHGPDDQLDTYRDQARALTGDSYYHYRARDVAAGVAPYASAKVVPGQFEPGQEEVAEFERWLQEFSGVGDDALLAQLSPAVAADPRLLRGTALWNIGWFAEARRELEGLRSAYSEDPVVSYRLALYFDDLGLYRSSILAARNVLDASPVNEFTAPRYLLKLLYPTHYAPTIIDLADQYGYDPLLQLALVRQESLFESFAASSAAAKGLSQVIPATGAYIASQLAWPDYEDADLYRPVVGLAFGAYYLDELLAMFEGDIGPALAGYNGGPGNAATWYAEATGDHDLLVETITFRETRLYLQRIYIGHAIYRRLYAADSPIAAVR